jgi:hypothetical protein
MMMRWVGHVARKGECFQVENSQVRNRLEDIGVDGMIILKWILKKYKGRIWIGFIWLMIGSGGGGLVKTVMNLWVPENVDNFLAN